MALIDDVDRLQSIYLNRATGIGNDDDERDYLYTGRAFLMIHAWPRWFPRG